jgi:hypothetical protein
LNYLAFLHGYPSLRSGFTAYLVLFPVNGSFATVAPEKLRLSWDLAPAPRCPNHTTSPYASGAYVYGRSRGKGEADLRSWELAITDARLPTLHPPMRDIVKVGSLRSTSISEVKGPI